MIKNITASYSLSNYEIMRDKESMIVRRFGFVQSVVLSTVGKKAIKFDKEVKSVNCPPSPFIR